MKFTVNRALAALAVLALVACARSKPAPDSEASALRAARESADRAEAQRFDRFSENPKTGFRLELEYHINEEIVTVHVSTRFASETVIPFRHPPNALEKVGSNIAEYELVSDLLKIPGVSQLTLGTYEISIHKGRVFRWEELTPAIEATVRSHLDKPTK